MAVDAVGVGLPVPDVARRERRASWTSEGRERSELGNPGKAICCSAARVTPSIGGRGW